MLSVIENIFVLNIDQYYEKKIHEPEDTQQDCCEGLGCWGFYLQLCLFSAGGSRQACLVQILWWKRKSRDKESALPLCMPGMETA